ncbi:MAG: hypothetical protein ABI972_08795 [Acidobacteriota bacterium]
MPKLDATSRRLLLLTAVLITLGMVHLARKGTSVSFPARRPGGSRLITWEESPFGFVLCGFINFLIASCIVLMGKSFIEFAIGEIRLGRRRGRW